MNRSCLLVVTFAMAVTWGMGISSQAHGQERISGSKYYCQRTTIGSTLLKYRQGSLLPLSFSQGAKNIRKRRSKILRKLKSTSENKRAKLRKRAKKFSVQLKEVKKCEFLGPLRPRLTYQQVKADCAGDFDVSFTEQPVQFDVTGHIAVMRGVITRTIVKDIESLLRTYPKVRTIVMAQGPGSDSDEQNVRAGRMVNEAGLSTCVPNGGEIASGAVDFFLAGRSRSLGDDTFVGVHSWANGRGIEGGNLPPTHKLHSLFLRYFADIGISANFYWFTLQAAPASGIYNMSELERELYGLETK